MIKKPADYAAEKQLL